MNIVSKVISIADSTINTKIKIAISTSPRFVRFFWGFVKHSANAMKSAIVPTTPTCIIHCATPFCASAYGVYMGTHFSVLYKALGTLKHFSQIYPPDMFLSKNLNYLDNNTMDDDNEQLFCNLKRSLWFFLICSQQTFSAATS